MAGGGDGGERASGCGEREHDAIDALVAEEGQQAGAGA